MRKLYILLAAFAMVIGAQAQEKSEAEVYNDGVHKGLDFSISSGYHVGVGDYKGGGSIPVEVSLGKQFKPNLYFGIGSGIWIGSKDADPMVPITFDSKIMFPQKTSALKPIVNFRLGYLMNIGGEKKASTESIPGYEDMEIETPGYKAPDFIMMEIMPGIQLPISNGCDFMLSAGYTHGFVTKGSGGGGYFSVKAGINFHKNPFKPKKPKYRREKVDTRDKGLQFTLEGVGNMINGIGYGGNLVCTWKVNPHLSVGGGLGYEILKPFESTSDFGEGDDIYYLYFSKSDGEPIENTFAYMGDVKAMKAFARGVYRMTDKRFSPFASLDLGVKMYSFSEELYAGIDMLEDPSTIGVFVAPAIGVSLRTTKNSYLELKAGYSLSSNLKEQKIYKDGDYISARSKNMAAAFVSLGFTHTFGERGKRIAR